MFFFISVNASKTAKRYKNSVLTSFEQFLYTSALDDYNNENGTNIFMEQLTENQYAQSQSNHQNN